MYFKKYRTVQIIRKRYDNNEKEINDNNSWNVFVPNCLAVVEIRIQTKDNTTTDTAEESKPQAPDKNQDLPNRIYIWVETTPLRRCAGELDLAGASKCRYPLKNG